MIRESDDSPNAVYLEEVPRVKDGKKYALVTRDYMAEGHDGYEALKECPRLIDEECGSLMSSLVRKYFLGMWPSCGLHLH